MDFGDLDLGQWIVIGLCIFLLVWYIVVTYLNRRRGIRIYRWIRDGLKKIGRVADVNWIGSSGSGAQISINRAAAPFQKINVLILMEMRELLPLWLINLLRNKRDEMILKAWLRNPPNLEVEVARKRNRAFSKLISQESKRPFEFVPGPEEFLIASRGKANPDGLEKLKEFLMREGLSVQRISVRREVPQLAVQVFISPLLDEPPGDFFLALQAWLQSMRTASK